MPEVRFDDLIPPTRPPPSLFETMWNHAWDSVAPGYLGPVPAPTARRTEVWPKTLQERSPQTIELVQDTQASPGRSLSNATPTEATTELLATPRQSDRSDETSQAPDVQSGNRALGNEPPSKLEQIPNGADQPTSPPRVAELRFDDLVPQNAAPAFWPGADVAWQSGGIDPLLSNFGIGNNGNRRVQASRIGIGHNGGPPLEDAWWRLLAARLPRGAPAALLGAILPSPLNRGDVEYVASRFAWPYGQLTRRLPEGFQAHHLNQNAAFRKVIAAEDGIAVGMRGNAISQPGTPHYDFHQSLESFWSPYRPNGELFGKKPTNAMYGEAVQRALEAAGLSPEEASYLAGRAREQRVKYGLAESAEVPHVPSRMNQGRTAEQRLRDRLQESDGTSGDSKQIDPAEK
jgi:hypothetical protein